MLTSRKIASLNIKITGKPSPVTEILTEELSMYPECDGDSPTDVVINMCSHSVVDRHKFTSKNPSIFSVGDEGLCMQFGSTSILWKDKVRQPLQIELSPPGVARKYRNKFRSMQYTYGYETIGQIFHELVLIPTLQMFFADRFALIHGSAIKSPEDEIFVFAGTGGVGKTSLMLELVQQRGFRFVADDISILDKQGRVHGNFAFPKIYGYNTLGYPKLKKRLMQNRSLADRLAWQFKMRFRGPANVRRRVDPASFFDGMIASDGKLARIYFLFRCDVPQLKIEEIDSAQATEMNMHVMKAEYYTLFNHLHWYRYNCLGNGQAPQDQYLWDTIWEKSEDIQNPVLQNASCQKVSVPMKMGAPQLKQELGKLV